VGEGPHKGGQSFGGGGGGGMLSRWALRLNPHTYMRFVTCLPIQSSFIARATYQYLHWFRGNWPLLLRGDTLQNPRYYRTFKVGGPRYHGDLQSGASDSMGALGAGAVPPMLSVSSLITWVPLESGLRASWSRRLRYYEGPLESASPTTWGPFESRPPIPCRDPGLRGPRYHEGPCYRRGP